MPIMQAPGFLDDQAVSFKDLSLSLFENSVDGIFVLNTEYEIIAWNKAMEHISGFTAHHTLGKNIREILPFTNAKDRKEFYSRALSGENIVVKDLPFSIPETNKSGWNDASYFPVRDSQKQITGMVAIIHATTQRKLAEIELHKREQLFRLITENASDLVALLSAEGIFTYVSPSSKELLGYSSAEMVGQSVYNFLHPDDKQVMQHDLAELSATESPAFGVCRFLRKEGDWRWFESFGKAVMDATNTGSAEMRISWRDITSRRVVEAQLQSKSKLLNGLLSNLPVMVQQINPNGLLSHVQGKALRNLGLEPADWEGTSLRSRDPLAGEKIQRAMLGESVSFTEQWQQSGKTVYFQSYFFPDLEQPGGAIGFSIDISEQKIAEEILLRNQLFVKKITNSTPFIIAIYDFDQQHFTYANHQISTLLGYTIEELRQLGTTLFTKLIHPADLPVLLKHVKQVRQAADGEILDAEFRVLNKAGNWRWFMTRSSVFKREGNGRAKSALSVTHDIEEERKSKALLFSVLNSSLNSIMAFRSVRNTNREIIDFEWTLSNRAAMQLVNLSEEELLGKHLLEMMPVHAENGLFNEYVQVVETGAPYHAEVLFNYPEVRIWLEITAVKLQDGFVATFANITEKKDAQDQIRKNEALLSEAKKIAHLGIWEWNVVQNSITWADELYEIYELQHNGQTITPALFFNFIHPEDRPRIEQGFKNTIEQGSPFDEQYRIVTPSHVIKTLAVKAERIEDLSGGSARILGTTLDVSEVVNLRQELESMRRVKMLGEAIPQIVWTTNPNGVTDYLNTRWYEYTGYETVAADQLDWSFLIHPDDVESTVSHWQQSIATGSILEMEYRLKNAEGMYRWHLARMVPLKNEQGEILKWFGTATDIHDHKKIQQEMEHTQHLLSEYNLVLNRKNAELQKINTDLDNFIYTASHDLKAPINNIEGLVDVLSSELDLTDPVISEVIERIHQSVGRFKSTVLGLTEVSKLERTNGSLPSLVQFSQLLSEVLSDIQQMVDESQAIIETDFEVTELRFDVKNLRSILYNLVSNALKYSRPGVQPHIKVTTEPQPDNKILLCVADNGTGIAPANQQRIFGMFQRIQTEVEGTGIGLFIVKRIVENAGGQIEVESEIGKGATFKVYLPLL